MRIIKSKDSEYLRIVDLYNQMVKVGVEYPGDVFFKKNFTYVYSWVDLITRSETENSFHTLLSDFLKFLDQSNYYIVPVWINMHPFEDMPIVEFNVEDSPAVYEGFWETNSKATFVDDFLNTPDGHFIFNESFDWLIFNCNYGINRVLYGFDSVQMLNDFVSFFDLGKIDFCSSEEVEREVESAYNLIGIDQFNKWIKPHLVYLKDDKVKRPPIEILQEVNIDKPILEGYDYMFRNGFIVFHPFYTKVFSKDYDFLRDYKLAAPLMQEVSWKQVMKQTEMKDFKKLALAITYPACNKQLQSLIEEERNKLTVYLDENKITEPYWEEDKIPEDILVSFLHFLLKKGYTEIRIGDWQNEVNAIPLSHDKLFDYPLQLEDCNLIVTSDCQYCLKLLYHDLPFTTFLFNDAVDVLAELGYEGFYADGNTKCYWYL